MFSLQARSIWRELIIPLDEANSMTVGKSLG
jgi:hypothetical protein